MEEDTKTCTKCGLTKPLSGFHRQPLGRGGRMARCRDCACAAKRAAYAADQNGLVATRVDAANGRPARSSIAEDGTKACKSCGLAKPTLAFHRMAESADGLQYECKACSSARKKAAYRKRKETLAVEGARVKTCKTCEATLPTSEFATNYSNRDGRSNTCQRCWRTYSAEYYERNRESIRERNALWRSADPVRVKGLERAARDRRKAADPAGYAAANRSRRAKWVAANPDKVRRISRESYVRNMHARRAASREYMRQWRQLNPGLASIRDNRKRATRRRNSRCTLALPFSVEQLEARLSMFPGCWMCGGPCETVDHVKPVTRGGAHILSNVRGACRTCNPSKGSQWYGPRETLRRFQVPVVSRQAMAA